jgi:hypothetical protein
MKAQSETKNLVEQIPAPDVIRQRLSVTLRESKALRQMLRLAERVHRDRKETEAAR